eukprot:TRINITY_DN2152_c0_g1_i1.p1 TRINITY_DN2152_c0_g1~~TRINITY_DN2152_c0_g1_i1.p1  ORF type:complete len:340 (-),score=102.37 TRINITY_DN2152_c0_g1_i1:537-1556(-)
MNSLFKWRAISTNQHNQCWSNNSIFKSALSKRRNHTESESSSIRLSPSARHILAQNNISPSKVKGSGRYGMILKEDALRFLSKPSSISSSIPQSTKITSNQTIKKEEQLDVEYEDIPNSNIRKIIAQRLTLSKKTIPHGYMSIDVNSDQLMSLRSSINEKGKVKVSVNDFIIRASAFALNAVPAVNSFWDEKKEESTTHKQVDISVAVATDKGLITPIIKNANYKNLPDISAEVQELAKKARENKLKPEEFQGGTFSISNLGMFSVESFSAVINPPQGAILAVGRGKPIVSLNALTDQPYLSSQISLTLSFDERAISPESAAMFLEQINSFLSHPHSLL